MPGQKMNQIAEPEVRSTGLKISDLRFEIENRRTKLENHPAKDGQLPHDGPPTLPRIGYRLYRGRR